MDQWLTRCPRLGDEVTFGYCCRERGDLPCARTLICWQHRFPVEAYLRARLTPEQWERWSCDKPKEKLASLIELIEEAKERLRAGRE